MAAGRIVLAVLLGAAVAGCGSGSSPRLDRADVAPLITLANRVATDDPCAQKRDLAAIRTQAKALINRHAVPAQLQEEFMSGVNDLAGRTPVCIPPPPPHRPPPPKKHHEHGKGHDKHGDGGDKG